MIRFVFLLFFLASSVSHAQTDEAFQKAREAYANGDSRTLDAQISALGGHALLPYVQYWRLSLGIRNASPKDIGDFLQSVEGSLIADRVRAAWMRELARRGNWSEFLSESKQLSTWDTEFVCYSIRARNALEGNKVLAEAHDLWFTGDAQPESCIPLFDAMFAHGILSSDDVWARIRLALHSGNERVAKSIVKHLPQAERPDISTINTIARRPQKYLQKKSLTLDSRADVELALYAMYKAARSWPDVAERRLSEVENQLDVADRNFAWGQVAMAAAWQHHPDAFDWYQKTRPQDLTDRQLEWRIRAGLRRGTWSDLPQCIEAMSPEERSSSQWRFWKARALSATGNQFEANALFASLSNEFNFYGQLAAENLGNTISSVPQTYRPDSQDIATIAEDPGLQRALALYHNEMRYEGALEWAWTVKDYNDRQLLSAAALASRHGWYERSIHTADRTKILHDFALRFPAPYRDLMREYTAELQLDEAWVYGLIRQESRFVPTAKSTAGAGGLMQLMPSTAKWIAKRLGFKEHHRKLVNQVDTNISMGTYYLRQVMDMLDNNPVLASAGYNAGPRRAERWRDLKPLEGDIYIETIPFPETRGYVKKVMSNTMYYARIFGATNLSLRERLGMVPARQVNTN